MAEQTEFSCVSCETTFDPSPTGGFCPDCDTPHPDYDAPGSDDSADDTETDGDDSEAVDDVADDGDDATDTEADDGGEEELEYVEDPEDDDEADAEDAEEQSDAEVEDSEDDEAEPDADVEDEADDDESNADEPEMLECQSCESAVDASAAFCPNCGEELEDETEAEDDLVELAACPDCGNSVDDESFCPSCGTDLDAIRESGTVEEEDDDVPQEVTLEIDGESYTFGDGDVFGRRDEVWLADLVSASGGRDEARYLSSDHLEFSVEDDGIYVTDISTNGTKHNGTAMDGSEAKLEDGDTLELADRAEIDVTLS